MNDEFKDIEDDLLNELKSEEEKSKKKRHIFWKVYAFYTTMAIAALVLLCAHLYEKSRDEAKKAEKYLKKSKDVEDEVKGIVKEYMEEGKGTMAMLREMFPENIIVPEGNRYLFMPLAEDVEKNDINNEDIVAADSGELRYVVNDKTVSHKGIDVSKYQGEIDWTKVAADGVEFAMIRLGYRGYGSGQIVLDESALSNIENATKAGIKVGVYFFSQAVDENEAIEEAKFVLEHIKNYEISYPVVFDTEEILDDAGARTEGLSADELSKIAIAFCDKIKEEGYTPAIYANLRWFALSLDMAQIKEYDKWYAYYDNRLYFPYKISMWQYTEKGTVNGINGDVDLNISFKDWK